MLVTLEERIKQKNPIAITEGTEKVDFKWSIKRLADV